MAKKSVKVKIWYDHEGDYLEIHFEKKAGHFRETSNDQIMENVDGKGNVIGFSVLRVSQKFTSLIKNAAAGTMSKNESRCFMS